METTKTMSRGTRRSGWAILIAGALASTGTACNLTTVDETKDQTDSTDSTPAGTCLYADCPVKQCTTSVKIRRDMLERCYGWDESTSSWATTAPGFVTDCDGRHANCSCDSSGICAFTFDADVYPDAQCALGNVGDTVSGTSCDYEGADTEAADQLAQQVTGDCQLEFPLAAENPVCAVPDTSDVKLGSDVCNSCGNSAAARTGQPPGASVTLSLDPAHSFLGVTTPVQSVMVRLSGDAFMDLPGNRLVGLNVSADRIRFGSSDWNGFRFSLDKPVPLARVGESFRIPVAQKPTIIATGRRDGALTHLRAGAANDITGHLSVAHGTWDLDFADQSVAGSVALHLVGRIAQ